MWSKTPSLEKFQFLKLGVELIYLIFRLGIPQRKIAKGWVEFNVAKEDDIRYLGMYPRGSYI